MSKQICAAVAEGGRRYRRFGSVRRGPGAKHPGQEQTSPDAAGKAWRIFSATDSARSTLFAQASRLPRTRLNAVEAACGSGALKRIDKMAGVRF